MDYEKKYKEALETARKLNSGEGVAAPSGWTVCEVIFPELKESEDDKIRKAIIAHIKDLRYYDTCYGVTPDEMVAWLEKQEDNNNQNWKPSKEQIGALEHFIRSIGESGYASPYDDSTKLLYSLLNDLQNLEKQGEQKHADKVEPKFKVRDWIVSDCNNVAYIESISETKYNLQCKDGHHEKMSIEYIDRYWHSWTIADAKDGDVLTYNDSKNNVWICIFKEYVNKRVYDYCTLDKENFWEYGSWNYLASFTYKPATKEQRNLLFQGMKEMGWEWDAEAKKLNKKLESFPILSNSSKVGKNETKWTEEDSKAIDNCCILIAAADDSYEKAFKDDCIHYLQNLKQRMEE